MVSSSRGKSATPAVRAPAYPTDPLTAIALFHRGRDPAHLSLRRLVRKLQKAGIIHAIVGGMAVYVHGHRRMTDDVDVLLTPAGFTEFKRLFVPKHYEQVPGRSRRFVDRANGVILDVLLTGLHAGLGKPGPITFPDPRAVRELKGKVYYIDLGSLMQLKLAARRHQDFADVVNLIVVHNLDESFLNKLHPSLRQDFIECLEEKRREEEYETRQ
jgi:hypothetical protein